MTDENVKTTETKSKQTSDGGKSETKTKEVSTEQKNTDIDRPAKSVTQTTTVD